MTPSVDTTLGQATPADIGLWIQWIASFVLLSLTFLVSRSVRRPWLVYWTLGWLSLFVALFCLLLTILDAPLFFLMRTVYFLGEYAFGFALLWGCRCFASDVRPGRRDLLFTLPFLALGLVLPRVGDDFNTQFGLHAGMMAILFGASFLSLLKIPKCERGPGFYVMSGALAVLCLDFAHDLPAFLWTAQQQEPGSFWYLRYTPFVDQIMELLLGFGMVMVTMERIRRDLERANAKLEVVAQFDPLTEALNRHAFHAMGLSGLEQGSRPVSCGCVAVVDMDNLKAINDTLGHAAGDLALRVVAKGIRSVIRADDLLFRWGGDEFLVLLWNLRPEDTEERFARLKRDLAGAELPPALRGAELSVSVGVAAYPTMGALDKSIEEADRAMYERKRTRRGPGE